MTSRVRADNDRLAAGATVELARRGGLLYLRAARRDPAGGQVALLVGLDRRNSRHVRRARQIERLHHIVEHFDRYAVDHLIVWP